MLKFSFIINFNYLFSRYIASFMIVDCGGGTVDLTTRELLEDGSLSEITERSGDYCGSSFIDQAFIKFVEEKVGKSAIESVINNHYGQLQFCVQEFCKQIKIPFTGIKIASNPPSCLDLEELLPAIQQYVKGEEKKIMEEDEWQIELQFDDVKGMFDPVIDKIIRLIKGQLDNNEKGCTTIFLVGGFSESKYLQARIKEEFGEIVPNISVPPQPITSVVKGGKQFFFILISSFNLM
jgi:actin-like ATPase involved in cell morphogenesis